MVGGSPLMTIDRVIRRRILLGFLVAASFGLLTAWYREVDDGPCIALRARWPMRPSRSRPPCSGSRGRSATSGAGAVDSPTLVTRSSGCRRSTSAGGRDRALPAELGPTAPTIARCSDFAKNPRFAPLLSDFTARGADVIERPIEPDAVHVLIDSGSASGVATGDAVVVGIDRDAPRSWGIVERVNAHSSVVTLDHEPGLRDRRVGATARPTASLRPGSDSGSLELDDVHKRYAGEGQRRRRDERLAGRRRSSTSSHGCRRASRSASSRRSTTRATRS